MIIIWKFYESFEHLVLFNKHLKFRSEKKRNSLEDYKVKTCRRILFRDSKKIDHNNSWIAFVAKNNRMLKKMSFIIHVFIKQRVSIECKCQALIIIGIQISYKIHQIKLQCREKTSSIKLKSYNMNIICVFRNAFRSAIFQLFYLNLVFWKLTEI